MSEYGRNFVMMNAVELQALGAQANRRHKMRKTKQCSVCGCTLWIDDFRPCKCPKPQKTLVCYGSLEAAYLYFKAKQRAQANRGGAYLVQLAYRRMEALARLEAE
jgi:hypothetical protein